MVSFVSIMQIGDGLASYRVNEKKDYYKAELITTTARTALPGELTISKPVCARPLTSNDAVRNKLVLAIKNTELNLDGTS